MSSKKGSGKFRKKNREAFLPLKKSVRAWNGKQKDECNLQLRRKQKIEPRAEKTNHFALKGLFVILCIAMCYNGQAKRERRGKCYAESKKRNNGGFWADHGNLPNRAGVYESFRQPYAMGHFIRQRRWFNPISGRTYTKSFLTKPGFMGCLRCLKERTPPMPI